MNKGTIMKAAEKRAKLYEMAEAAKPQPIFPDGDERNGGDDWGSERQIEAANAFHIFVSDDLGVDTDDMQTAKADTIDLINEACRRAEAQLIVEELQEDDAASLERFQKRWAEYQKWRPWQEKPTCL